MIGGEREGMFGKSQRRRPFPGGGAAACRLLSYGAGARDGGAEEVG